VNTVDWTPETLVANIDDLVTLPEVALRIANMVDDPTSSAAAIGREICNDAALTARLLRVANSPVFGHDGKIATISRAITVLGVRQVRDLTVGITAIRTFDGIANELVTMESFWRQSVLCALAAGHIAARRQGGRHESPFVAGLLHDIGQLVLFNRAPELAREALLMSIYAADEPGLYRCEREVMGFDHGVVGVRLAQKWGLPRVLQECIQYHHDPSEAKEYPIEVATIHVANTVAVLAEIGGTDLRDGPAISSMALRALKLDQATLAEIVLETQESAQDLLPLLTGAPMAVPALAAVQVL
jgi:putative nucleotidyltransferase with HDIG domain